MADGRFLPEAAEYWRARIISVGKAQSRYIFVLCLVGLFYLALTSRLVRGSGAPPPQPLQLPFVAIEIDALVVWAAAPAAIGLILLAILGTFYAMDTASYGLTEVLGINPLLGSSYHESLDSTFNFLDALSYTREDSPRIVQVAARLTYPVLLTAFYVEAVVLWFLIRASCVPSPEGPILLSLGVIALFLPLYRFFRMWKAAVRPLTGLRSGKKTGTA